MKKYIKWGRTGIPGAVRIFLFHPDKEKYHIRTNNRRRGRRQDIPRIVSCVKG